jgi:hypothetical protein
MSDRFEAPRSGHTAARVDLDADPPTPTWMTWLSAGAMGLGGVLGGAHAVQLLIFVGLQGVWALVPWALGLLSVGLLACAGFTTRGRAWAAILGACLAALQVLVAIAWIVASLAGGLLVPLALIWALTSLPVAGVAPLTLPDALRITAWRRAMLADPG